MSVVDEDTFSAAKLIIDKKPCCLNFASHKRPGGGYKAVRNLRMPIRTQEEDIFRRSNLPELMDIPEVKKYYPLTGKKAIYCPEVTVTKDKKLDSIVPFVVSVITVPAVVNPDTQEKEKLVVARARRIFEIAADNDERCLVLGAWGCGVFNNDPRVIAELFKRIIESEFSGFFREVVFAIPGKDSHNHKIFEGVIGSSSLNPNENTSS